MNKVIKFSAALAAISIAATAWGAATTFGDSASTGTQTQAVDSTTFTNLSESVTLKLSKGVFGAHETTIGGGALGVAAGTPHGKGFIYRQGTSTTAANVNPKSVTAADINAAAVGTAAEEAATS